MNAKTWICQYVYVWIDHAKLGTELIRRWPSHKHNHFKPYSFTAWHMLHKIFFILKLNPFYCLQSSHLFHRHFSCRSISCILKGYSLLFCGSLSLIPSCGDGSALSACLFLFWVPSVLWILFNLQLYLSVHRRTEGENWLLTLQRENVFLSWQTVFSKMYHSIAP